MSAMGIALACGGWLFAGLTLGVMLGKRIRAADNDAGLWMGADLSSTSDDGFGAFIPLFSIHPDDVRLLESRVWRHPKGKAGA